jgi:hypothetical protein
VAKSRLPLGVSFRKIFRHHKSRHAMQMLQMVIASAIKKMYLTKIAGRTENGGPKAVLLGSHDS